ncbi:hypothetical protein K431DRAFT_218686 [Polychaeton citri CBS 116435]|uniref:Uncharacterized protein n=1 Tax=Polychaeton citri CBS 116435 TaxID=1314669 RepID=A0A9P4QBC1_9PEZI|nr:hypothetical protein K431DRAFT_218686 [Polychaeton citri CBS 116435]
MAAPPLPQTPSAGTQPSQGASAVGSGAPSPTVGTPQSPAAGGNITSSSLEQRRVALLLDINLDLLQEINRLQAQGKGGATSPQHLQQLKSTGQPVAMASEEYIQCMRRVQANMSYLVPLHSGTPAKKPPGPVHMTPPPHLAAQLAVKYEQLKEAFPGWPGYDHRMSGSGPAGGNLHMGGGSGTGGIGSPTANTAPTNMTMPMNMNMNMNMNMGMNLNGMNAPTPTQL